MFEPLSDGELAVLPPERVLAYVEAAHRAQRVAEAAVVAGAVAWAHAHGRLDDQSSTARGLPGVEHLLTPGGDGTPAVGEFCVAELGAVLEVSTGSATLLVADALDLSHRLSALWRRVSAGEVPAWKARRVADRTRDLDAAAVSELDEAIAAVAGRLPMSRLDRVVRAAVINAQPATAVKECERAVADRGVWVSPGREDGNSEIFIRTDTASALRFEAAIVQTVRGMDNADGVLGVQQRRAAAVGLLLGVDGAGAPIRPATLYVHIDQAALSGQAYVARVEGAGPLPAETVRGWLTGCTVTVKPVIDLANQTPVDAWETPLSLREATQLRTPIDTFPYSTCDTRTMDLDHTIAYHPHGPPGQTRPDNLAPLTRKHHRIKTHGRWQVAQPFNGVLVWKSPHGHHYLVDHTGTQRPRRI